MAQLHKNTDVNIKHTAKRFISYIVANKNSTDNLFIQQNHLPKRATPVIYYVKSLKKVSKAVRVS